MTMHSDPTGTDPLGDGISGSGAIDAAASRDETVASPVAPADELGAARAQADEYLDLLRRTRADFTNFKRRVDEERTQIAQDARVDLILKLLPIVDDFERALASIESAQLETGWAKGIQLIERNLRSMLASEDVHRIDADGQPFDPWQHEAITSMPTVDAAEGTVLHVTRPGYRRGDRVIRPAQVVVAQAPPA